MKRGRAYYRYQRKRHIKRKMGILRRVGGEEYLSAWSRDEYGRLSKGKIHCSCWMCRTKSYDEPAVSDWRTQVGADQQVKEYLLYEKEAENAGFYSSGETQQERTESIP